MRDAGIVVALSLAGCAGDGLAPARPARECTASDEAVSAYLSRVAGIASNHSRSDVAARHESGVVSFALAPDGSVSDLRVVRASRPAMGEGVLQAVAAGSPYPRPSFDPRACLVGSRAEIGLISHGRCDEARDDEYIEGVSARILEGVQRAGLTALEPERISLRIKVDRQGIPKVAVQDAPSAESGERVASVARSLPPFEPPDESIADCVSDQPFWVWIELPGTTRPPERIR